jgi:acyl-CoA synthetase (AMP-forming)/AMP-acid ligase II
MLDTCDWPAVFLGAIKAGVVPVALNTPLTPRTTVSAPRQRRRAPFVPEALLKA